MVVGKWHVFGGTKANGIYLSQGTHSYFVHCDSCFRAQLIKSHSWRLFLIPIISLVTLRTNCLDITSRPLFLMATAPLLMRSQCLKLVAHAHDLPLPTSPPTHTEWLSGLRSPRCEFQIITPWSKDLRMRQLYHSNPASSETLYYHFIARSSEWGGPQWDLMAEKMQSYPIQTTMRILINRTIYWHSSLGTENGNQIWLPRFSIILSSLAFFNASRTILPKQMVDCFLQEFPKRPTSRKVSINRRVLRFFGSLASTLSLALPILNFLP